MPLPSGQSPSDVCLVLEGTYPFVTGGVSGWTHDLILSQPELTFHLVCLMPKGASLTPKYQIPKNVTGVTHVILQELPKKLPKAQEKDLNPFFKLLKNFLKELIAGREDLESLAKLLEAKKRIGPLSEEVLLNSKRAWQMMKELYEEEYRFTGFLNFFWSCRSLFGSLFSLMNAEIPKASLYHSACTGFAGFFLTMCHLLEKKPCLVTEHGIYTNERKIEIASAKWLQDQKAMTLALEDPFAKFDLKDLWIRCFTVLSKFCYSSANPIITLFEGNQLIQVRDGAPKEKLRVIPNGIDFEKFAACPKKGEIGCVIALIGRVVPIKDIKTFIRAVGILKGKIDGLKAYVLGPEDEDPEYYEECLELQKRLELEETLTFTGKVSLTEYLPTIDLIVLTSISESQPLVILEAGAAKVPCVATDVGSCRELIMGSSTEKPHLGIGGAVVQLASPEKTAEEIEKLLKDGDKLRLASSVIYDRVKKYYRKELQKEAYQTLYTELMTH